MSHLACFISDRNTAQKKRKKKNEKHQNIKTSLSVFPQLPYNRSSVAVTVIHNVPVLFISEKLVWFWSKKRVLFSSEKALLFSPEKKQSLNKSSLNMQHSKHNIHADSKTLFINTLHAG